MLLSSTLIEYNFLGDTKVTQRSKLVVTKLMSTRSLRLGTKMTTLGRNISTLSSRTAPAPLGSNKLATLLTSNRATQLFQFQGSSSAIDSGGAIWTTIRGVQGLLGMYSDCGTVIAAAKALERLECPGSALPLVQLISSTRYLRLILLGCAIESGAVAIRSSIPRIQALSCAHAYCDIHASLTSLVDFCEPKAISPI